MVDWGSFPVAYANAFGGVETGIMNAQEAPIPVSRTRGVADMPISAATVTIKGHTRAAAAVLEQIKKHT